MITSAKILNRIKSIMSLHEDWFKSGKGTYGSDFTIYVNPTSSDYKELSKAGVKFVRFVADSKSQKVYVVDDKTLLHYDLEKFAHVDPSGIVLEGYAALYNGKIVMSHSDSLRIENLYDPYELTGYYQTWIVKLATANWSWCNKYVDVSEFINKLKVAISKW